MTEEEERTWAYILANRKASPHQIAEEAGVSVKFVDQLIARISSPDWRENVSPRTHNVGESDYATRNIQPWDIWLEYRLNPWDADIIKRVLRKKPGQRRLDYEKIKHICDERIRQIDEGFDHAEYTETSAPTTAQCNQRTTD